jgi:hypothetical protein
VHHRSIFASHNYVPGEEEEEEKGGLIMQINNIYIYLPRYANLVQYH